MVEWKHLHDVSSCTETYWTTIGDRTYTVSTDFYVANFVEEDGGIRSAIKWRGILSVQRPFRIIRSVKSFSPDEVLDWVCYVKEHPEEFLMEEAL